MPEVPGAARRILKATYAPLTVDLSGTTPGRAVLKFGYVRQLQLQPGEVAAVKGSLSTADALNPSSPLFDQITAFEGAPLPSQLPSSDIFTTTNATDLIAFGTALNKLRAQRTTQASPGASATSSTPSTGTSSNALATHLLNAGLTATNAFSQTWSATPIGLLNLERLEMTPAGIERGELLATIPLAPLEQTSVVQKEWSVISNDFTSVVTDSLENYSETGVTDSTELAQSTNSQNQHSNQFNVNATVSGSMNFATIAQANASVGTSFGSQDQNSSSAQASTKHAIATTKKASSRSKQSHKISISTSTVTGTSESTTRTLQNPSSTDPMRVDYFSLMRKWLVGLYRYGLRMTYDIVIPEPGAAFREAYAQLADLQSKMTADFNSYFNVPVSSINVNNYQQLASQWGAQVPAPPAAQGPISVGGTAVQGIDPNNPGNVTFWPLQFSVPDGYWITQVSISGYIGDNHGNYLLDILGYAHEFNGGNEGQNLQNIVMTGFLLHATGSQTITSALRYGNPAVVEFTVQIAPTDDAWTQWQIAVWNALYNAAQTTFYATQQSLQAQITALQNRLNNVDTLTLRREENDEITKGVLRWLLGPGFEFMPNTIASLFQGPQVDWGNGYSTSNPNQLGLNAFGWTVVSIYEQMVRFINDAIDWDNIIYFLYSYFWDVPQAWDNIRNIQHPDATRQAFLRAGSARVVLTVRKGWETAWVQFVEGGTFTGGPLPQDHPYLTIAQEIQDYDNTNYPGIPPANPGGAAPPDDGQYAGTVSSATLSPSSSPVTIAVDSSTGFVVGYTAIIDTWESNVQETSTIVAIPDATHITVSGLANAHSTANGPYPVILGGEKGILIAQWFEYTPNSGTDIAVSSDLTTIA